MTIQGPDGEMIHGTTPQAYALEAQKNIQKFEENLVAYKSESDEKTKNHIEAVMDDAMSVIHSALSEVGKSGINKQSHLVDKDYQDYKTSGSDEDYTQLTQDLSTLKQYVSESIK